MARGDRQKDKAFVSSDVREENHEAENRDVNDVNGATVDSSRVNDANGHNQSEAGQDIQEAPQDVDSSREFELKAELDDVRTQLLRVHADFDNFRKRTRQEKEDLQKYATKKLLGDLLPIVDNFDRALASVTSDETQSNFVQGVEMVHRQLLGLLEQNQVRPMQCVGESFNPELHDAVMQEPAENGGAAGIVVAELQKGYFIADRVLRPAMVKVTV